MKVKDANNLDAVKLHSGLDNQLENRASSHIVFVCFIRVSVIMRLSWHLPCNCQLKIILNLICFRFHFSRVIVICSRYLSISNNHLCCLIRSYQIPSKRSTTKRKRFIPVYRRDQSLPESFIYVLMGYHLDCYCIVRIDG